MLVRIFTLKFDPVTGSFDDRDLRDFIKDKEVLSIRDHFFTRDEMPYLTVIVTYNLLQPEENAKPSQEKKEEDREKWRLILEETDWPLFNTLREWRNQQAREEGIPPYVICSNRQLAHIAHQRPASLDKLAMIEGLGRAKLERYGGLIRFRRREREQAYQEGRIDECGLVQSVQSMLGHIQHANTLHLRRNHFRTMQGVEG